jgi:hydroxymethylpyrimidine/phosphomethylpyrimidine kinase
MEAILSFRGTVMGPICLSIAGFDGSGGAGIQADLKTFSAFSCYGTTILTALPIQNTQGVKGCYELPLQSIQDQLETIFEDMTPASIKIGMLFSADIVHVVSEFLRPRASSIPIVLDPVMIAKSGDSLLKSEAIDALESELIPLATLITPNIPEAIALVGQMDFENLGIRILGLGSKAVLLKGGHCEDTEFSTDLFLSATEKTLLTSPRIHSKNTHGTGCTLSAAISANLALGLPILDACRVAKEYLYQAILAAKDHSVGKGNGPVNHLVNKKQLG